MIFLGWMVFVLVIVCGIFFIGFLVYELWTTKNRAPFIPSSSAAIKIILKQIDFPDQGLVMDLGAGEGRVLRAIKKSQPRLLVRGVEISPLALLIGRIENIFNSVKIDLRRENMFEADISQADIIFCFLLTKDLARLEKKLQKDMKPGARLISNTFSFPHWKPSLEISPAESGLYGYIRVYTQPER